MNFGLVKDSFCCNEISDKLIIKQTYIISLNTFLSLIHPYMVQFFPSLQFICFSALFHLGLGSSFPPKSLESVLCQFPKQIHGKQNATEFNPHKLKTFQFKLLTLIQRPCTQELNAWCGVHLVYCEFAYSRCYNVHLLLNVCFLNLAYD